ncbi:hypothetical protein IU448_27900 [Nocardia flavorosea]|uniref:hypothetical protein n=1 Tax=Nocardia flavorosea TaxID=53429 RepID=UPI00189333D6|nr:hypothetical protein [Nocardia flavorosea]MBF6352804.1 hypothetical protein [Nocardia flavorosea]
MSVELDPEDLRAAAGTMALLPEQISGAPMLAATAAAEKLKGSSIGVSLNGSDSCSRTAKDVLKARFSQLAALLSFSADNFQGSDMDAANRLNSVSDINSGSPR